MKDPTDSRLSPRSTSPTNDMEGLQVNRTSQRNPPKLTSENLSLDS